MNTDDLISVIIPAYNHEKYVQESINSIIGQTYQNLEIIIVDDGSTDATWDKINELKEECEKRFARVVLKKQKNSGTVKTLDETLYMANGKYIYYIASDDIAHPEAIEILRKNIGDAGLIFPDIAWIDSVGKRFYLDENCEKTYDKEKAFYATLHEYGVNRFWPDVDGESFDFYANLLKGNYINIGFLLLRQAAIDVGGWNKDIILEDYFMHLQIAKKYKMKRVNDVLFYYRKHAVNASSNADLMQEGIRLSFMNEKMYCYENGYRKLWNKIYLDRYSEHMNAYDKLKFRFWSFIDNITCR
jgi:alpha-1,3-rhamnosyltransferase